MESKSEEKSSGFASLSLSILLCEELSRAVGIAALASAGAIDLSSSEVLVWSVIIWAAKVFSWALPRSWPSLAAAISVMSLMAASLTKSAGVGLMPSVALTPGFSPTDWAKAD